MSRWVFLSLVKVFSDNGDVILALEMNGEPLPIDHGWPVRVLVPGSAGARCPRWDSNLGGEDVRWSGMSSGCLEYVWSWRRVHRSGRRMIINFYK